MVLAYALPNHFFLDIFDFDCDYMLWSILVWSWSSDSPLMLATNHIVVAVEMNSSTIHDDYDYCCCGLFFWSFPVVARFVRKLSTFSLLMLTLWHRSMLDVHWFPKQFRRHCFVTNFSIKPKPYSKLEKEYRNIQFLWSNLGHIGDCVSVVHQFSLIHFNFSQTVNWIFSINSN